MLSKEWKQWDTIFYGLLFCFPFFDTVVFFIGFTLVVPLTERLKFVASSLLPLPAFGRPEVSTSCADEVAFRCIIFLLTTESAEK